MRNSKYKHERGGAEIIGLLVGGGLLLLVWLVYSLVMGGIKDHQDEKRRHNQAVQEAKKPKPVARPVNRHVQGRSYTY